MGESGRTERSRAAPAHRRARTEDEDLPPGSAAEIAGIVVPPIGRPRLTYSAAGVQLFESEIPGRNAGRAIAIRERATNRHRWVVVTRGCVQGTTVRWVGAVGNRIIGVTQSRHGVYAAGDAILIIDVPSGTAWAMRLPEHASEANREGDTELRTSLANSILTFRIGEETSSIDLGPILATTPAPHP